MADAVENESVYLVRSVQKRELSKKGKEEERQPQNVLQQKQQQDTVVPYLPKDCISNILVRLPIESLIPKSMLVCKPWYNIITSPTFINSHFSRSESVLVFQRAVLDEEQPNPPGPILVFWGSTFNKTAKFSIQFFEFKEGNSRLAKYKISCSGKIRASCNGLLLMDSAMKRGGLMVVNPITGKWDFLPVGSLVPPHAESYGFAYSDATGDYKVVHLFRDELGYVNCEILNVGAKYWKEVNGPAFGLFGWLGYTPVPAIGALHWIPQIDHGDYLVSLELANEKFHRVPLPKSCRTYDRILEMGRFLSFVAHDELDIDIWILKGLHDEVWTKHHRIRTIGCVLDMIPILSLKIGGDMIFTREEDGSLHAYDFKLGLMRKVPGHIPPTSFPHVNSLIWWGKSSGCV